MSSSSTIVVDVSGLLDEETLHEILYTKLDLMPEYGFNFDALWDCITDNELSTMPQVLSIEGLEDLKLRLPFSYKKLTQCFKDYAAEFPERTVHFEGGSPSGFGLDVGDATDDA